MPRYTKESLERLRQKIDLPELLGQHLSLKRAGSSYKALCPFHDEKTPSFIVHKGSSHYHCFGCGAHGDAIHFLMQHLRMSFSDAVVHLADRFQVQLEEALFEGKKSNRVRLKEANDLATRFYQYMLLHTEEGKEALEYLYKRGLESDFITTFTIGLAPRDGTMFYRYARDKGFEEEILLEAGLIAERQGRIYDFFSERIVFPIQDVTNATIGFSGRKYREKTFGGKYINTIETPLFKKSQVLFGYNYSRRRIAKEKQAIIVEGQLDALRLIYHGFTSTVAALGTAFGEAHVHELVRLGVARVFLLFDGDEAGGVASVKVGHLFQKQGVEVLVARLEPGQDPDSLLLKKGPLAIVEACTKAEEYLTFLFQHLGREVKLSSPAEKDQFLQEIMQRIRDWNNPVMVHESIKKLASLAQVPEQLLGIETRTPMVARKTVVQTRGVAVDPDRILEVDLLRWIVLTPTHKEIIGINLTEEDFCLEVTKSIFRYVMTADTAIDLLQLVTEVDHEEVESVVSEMVSKKINHDKAHDLVIATIRKIKERNWMRQREALSAKIQAAQGNEDEVMRLVKEFDRIKSEIPEVRLVHSLL